MDLEDGAGNQRQRLFGAQEKVLQSIGSTPLGVLKEEVAGASSGLKQPPCVKTGYNKQTSLPFLSPRTEARLPNPVWEMEGPALGHKHVAPLGAPKPAARGAEAACFPDCWKHSRG